MVIVFFLKKDLSEKDRNAIGEKLKKSSEVIKIQFISSEQALGKFLEKFPELQGIVNNLKINPFPPSFEATLKEKILSSDETQSFIQSMQNMKGIDDVQFNKDWAERMQSLSRLAKAVGFFLGGILILASFFIISNVIKLSVFARKDEIGILRLVGATNTFIRIPFLLDGIIMGILGGMLSLFVLFLVIKLFPLYLGSSLGALNELINFRYLSLSQSISLIGAGAVIGFLGSFSSLAQFLKV